MTNGVLPVKKDHRDYSGTRTFGALQFAPNFAERYDCDLGIRFPDQNAEGLPEACTAYATTELCADEDRVPYQPIYTYHKTLFMDGSKEGDPCHIRTSLKSACLYGVLPNTTPLKDAAIAFMNAEDSEAAKHKRSGYFVVEKSPKLDWFDSMRNMLVAGAAIEYDTGKPANRAITLAVPWFPEWSGTSVNSTGIVAAPTEWVWRWGHNVKISGWETFNGQPYLKAKSWQGALFGDHGWLYFSRDIMNRVMEVEGSGAFQIFRMNPDNPVDVQLVKLTWLDWLQSFGRYVMSQI